MSVSPFQDQAQNQGWQPLRYTIATTWPLGWQPALRVLGTALSNLFSVFRRGLLTLLIILGSGTLYEHAVGDGVMPRLNELGSVQELKTLALANSTAHFITVSDANAPGAEPDAEPDAEQGWQALARSRELLSALSPEMGLWLHQLRRNYHIEYAQGGALGAIYSQTAETATLAAYDKLSGKLMIHPGFWGLNDGEKAAVLAHEYRHSRQNWPKKISVQLAQLVAGGQLRYQSQLEAEAFDYERQARSALGLPSQQVNGSH